MKNVIKLFESNIGSVDIIRRLSGGLSNEIYLINDLFIWKEFKNKYLFNHDAEREIIKNLNHIHLYYYDEKNICYDYIEGDNITNTYYNNNISEIIDITKKYHQLQITVESFWYDIIPSWMNILPNQNFSFTDKKELENIYLNLTKFLKTIHDEKDIVLCHHDIHSGNIIKKDNNLELIDLEFSFLNYCFVDLGNIICELYTDYAKEEYNYDLINNDIIIKIAKLYFNNYNDNSIEKIKLGIRMSHFYWCLWGILVDLKQDNYDFDYLNFSKERFKYLK